MLAVTLVALAAFDLAAIAAMRGYLLSQTGSRLRKVLDLLPGLRPAIRAARMPPT